MLLTLCLFLPLQISQSYSVKRKGKGSVNILNHFPPIDERYFHYPTVICPTKRRSYSVQTNPHISSFGTKREKAVLRDPRMIVQKGCG